MGVAIVWEEENEEEGKVGNDDDDEVGKEEDINEVVHNPNVKDGLVGRDMPFWVKDQRPRRRRGRVRRRERV